MKKIIIVIGPPGSGKGTQAKKIAHKHAYAHLSTGDMLRTLAQQKEITSEERQALDEMKAGRLAPDALIYKLAFKAIESQVDAGHGVVLDGAIRSVAQAQAYQDFFEKKGYTKDILVLDITLSDEEAYTRLTARRMCRSCGEIIPAGTKHYYSICPKCSGELVTRLDDKADVVKERIALQGNRALAPIRDWFKQHDILATVDGTQAIEQVEKDIEKTLA